jgi:hypothetical protein
LYSSGTSDGSVSLTGCAGGGGNSGSLSPMRAPGGMSCAASTPGLSRLYSAMSSTRGGMKVMPRAMP